MKGKLLDKPLFYIYKITFSDDSTYIGCHIQWKTKDDYICSSLYYKRHPELTIKNREILFYLPSLEQMNIMETISIMEDKCYSPKNINGNYGNWLYNFHTKLDCPWNKDLKMTKEFSQKMSRYMSEPVICIDTLEIIDSHQLNQHMSEICLMKRKTLNGKHYRKVSKEEKEKIIKGDLKETLELNKAFLIELYKDETFFYCKEYDIAWQCLESLAGMLKTNTKTLKENFGKNYKGYTIITVDSSFVFGNEIKLLKKLESPKWSTKKVRCIETGEIFESIKEANEKYKGHISNVLNGTRKTAGGCHWEAI